MLHFRKAILAGAFLFLVASVDSKPALAQATNCTANQAASCAIGETIILTCDHLLSEWRDLWVVGQFRFPQGRC